MPRYVRIQSVSFGGTALALPLSIRLCRKADTAITSGDSDLFATSIQLARQIIIAELRTRETAAAESLSVGQQETLSFTVAPGQAGAASRTISLVGAVLTDVELTYEQSSMAVAKLRFAAEASDGATDPFSAEESQ